MKTIQGMTRARLEEILNAMSGVRAVLIGDMCLDVYWSADMTRSVLSRETPHYPLPVTEERMSPGAGGNAAMNMATLAKENFIPVGMVGDDWRGTCLMEVFAKSGVDTSHIVQVKGRVTNAYCKPMRRGYLGFEVEDPRIDFESFDPLNPASEEHLIAALKDAAKDAQVVCVSDQFENGCITQKVRDAICALAKDGMLTIVDSRSRIALYEHCLLKPNEIECARALGLESEHLKDADETVFYDTAKALSEKTASAVALTLGERGSLIYRNGRFSRVEAVKVDPPVDTVGAGDCFLSAFSLALAVGANEKEAGVCGALATAVSVKKLGTTGTATAEEILKTFDEKAE